MLTFRCAGVPCVISVTVRWLWGCVAGELRQARLVRIVAGAAHGSTRGSTPSRHAISSSRHAISSAHAIGASTHARTQLLLRRATARREQNMTQVSPKPAPGAGSWSWELELGAGSWELGAGAHWSVIGVHVLAELHSRAADEREAPARVRQAAVSVPIVMQGGTLILKPQSFFEVRGALGHPSRSSRAPSQSCACSLSVQAARKHPDLDCGLPGRSAAAFSISRSSSRREPRHWNM
jgi:hypothetical protein